MAELSEVVRNPELVTAALGSWPSFHDAEILNVELSRAGRMAKLTIKMMPYDPAGNSNASLLTLLFKGIEEVSLANFNEQNVVWALTVERHGERLTLKLASSYGLEGSFAFDEVEVLEAKPLP